MKRVAIVGAEEQTRALAPWDNPDFDIWLFNDWAAHDWCKRFDATIDIHPVSVIKNPANARIPDYWGWLTKERGKLIYMQEALKEVPDSAKYPLDEINTEFMTTLTFEGERVKIFRSSVAYAVALALYQQRPLIDIWGVELVASSEYRSEKDNFAFWVGLATGRKVPVTLHCSRGTFDMPLYGYEDSGLTNNRLVDYIKGMTEQKNEVLKQTAMLDGALQFAVQLQKDIGDAKA
jgi:hypothetical protein